MLASCFNLKSKQLTRNKAESLPKSAVWLSPVWQVTAFASPKIAHVLCASGAFLETLHRCSARGHARDWGFVAVSAHPVRACSLSLREGGSQAKFLHQKDGRKNEGWLASFMCGLV